MPRPPSIRSPRIRKSTRCWRKGPNKASVRFGLEGLQVDLRALPKESYGAALQYFTGSKEHSIPLRARAQKMGLTLSEYSLSRVDTKEIVARETEEQIYEALGLRWIPPELRENQGEIEAAEAGTLPKLVELGDIRGDLHMHTHRNRRPGDARRDGRGGARVGYEYIAITDHSKALAMANGLDEKRAVAFAHQVREMDQSGLGIRVFSGLECDIRRDGAMDLEDDALGELDFVIGSVHSYMNLEAAEMTDRLLRALECPHLRALGHPTGRILLNRDAYPVRFRRGGGGGGAAQRVSRNQRQPRAPGSDGVAGAGGESPRREVRHLDRRASSQASGQHALRRSDGAARVAGGRRYSEYSAREAIRAGDQIQMKLISSKKLLHTPIFEVTMDHAIDPDGFEIKRAIVQHGGSAVMMPIDDRRRVLLVKQYRLPARRYHVGAARRPRR